jgi:hypothetical protein
MFHAHGNRQEAMKLLGASDPTMRSWEQKYGSKPIPVEFEDLVISGHNRKDLKFQENQERLCEFL